MTKMLKLIAGLLVQKEELSDSDLQGDINRIIRL